MAKQVINSDEDILSLLKQAEKIVFKEDTKSICDQLDMLFSIASKSQIQNEESDVFEIKIRSGIMRLKKLEAFDEAAFYETEIIRITKTNTTKKKTEFYYFLFSIVGLVLIACFGNKLLYEFFSLYKKVIDTLIHYFK
jgi:hypothetical protein